MLRKRSKRKVGVWNFKNISKTYEAAVFSNDLCLPLLPILFLVHSSVLRFWSFMSPWVHRTEQRKIGFSLMSHLDTTDLILALCILGQA